MNHIHPTVAFGSWLVAMVIVLGNTTWAAEADAIPLAMVSNPPSRSTLADKALQTMGSSEEIVFAVRRVYKDGHYYATCGHWSADPNRMMYADGGAKLCKLNLRTRKVTVLVDDPQGGVRDPRVDYDGKRLLFAYRKGGTKYFHLYEIQPDGTNLRQVTSGDCDDIEPEYLPDGGIVFISTRGNRFVPCYHTQVGLLYRMDADGGNVRLLSGNNVGDHRPAMLPDGRVIYTRWEYVDRAPQKFHSLWTMNPDGTDQMVLFGNTVAPSGEYFVMIDALPIPGSDKVVAVFSPGHGNRESAGIIMVVDPKAGPDDWSRVRQISPPRTNDGGWQGGRRRVGPRRLPRSLSFIRRLLPCRGEQKPLRDGRPGNARGDLPRRRRGPRAACDLFPAPANGSSRRVPIRASPPGNWCWPTSTRAATWRV